MDHNYSEEEPGWSDNQPQITRFHGPPIKNWTNKKLVTRSSSYNHNHNTKAGGSFMIKTWVEGRPFWRGVKEGKGVSKYGQ